MKRITWFVLTEKTEYTVAICQSENIAQWIANNYTEKCIVRKSEF